jgi:hypothetical protein
MKNLTKSISILDRQRDDAERGLREAEEALNAARAKQAALREAGERLLLDVSRTLDLTNLPPRVLAAGLHYLAIHGDDPRHADAWIAACPLLTPKAGEADTGLPPLDRSGPAGLLPVEIRVGHNISSDKRAFLSVSGVKWNGRKGHWLGQVAPSVLPLLQAKFGDKVTVPHATVPHDPPEAQASPQEEMSAAAASSADGPDSRGGTGEPMMPPAPQPPNSETGLTPAQGSPPGPALATLVTDASTGRGEGERSSGPTGPSQDDTPPDATRMEAPSPSTTLLQPGGMTGMPGRGPSFPAPRSLKPLVPADY